LCACNLTPDLAENNYVNLTGQGTIRLDLKIGAALTHIVTIIAYAESENMIDIGTSYSISATIEYKRYRLVRGDETCRAILQNFQRRHSDREIVSTGLQHFADSEGRGVYFDLFGRSLALP
jgi:hypothetical protein